MAKQYSSLQFQRSVSGGCYIVKESNYSITFVLEMKEMNKIRISYLTEYIVYIEC